MLAVAPFNIRSCVALVSRMILEQLCFVFRGLLPVWEAFFVLEIVFVRSILQGWHVPLLLFKRTLGPGGVSIADLFVPSLRIEIGGPTILWYARKAQVLLTL